MRNGGRAGVSAVVLGLVVATAPMSVAQPRAEAHDQIITLVTGDQVVLDHDQPREVRPGPGRDGMRFSVYKTDGHTYVVPADAASGFASGRFDRRLFDLTTLTEFGYDTRATIPLIVTGTGARAAAARALDSIDGYAYTAEKGSAWRTLTATRGVDRIWLDGKRKALLDHSVPQIGAPAAWAAGYTGEGVTVAVLDTGVDETHPDLADREIAQANFTASPDNADHFGHGTHVASTVAGTGAKSGGKYRGVASGASILDAKVLDDGGFGQDSWIIAGMEWAAEQGADIANLSLGGPDTPEVDPLEAAVDTLSERYGTLFVIAAGNDGGDATISSPGSADAALTVGAVDREDNLAGFSSRGPRIGDGAIKPDVTAPGVAIVAALHADGTIGAPVEPGYTALSGTSMATPHVAGAAALLAQQHPDYTGARLKSVLSASAKPHADLTAFEQGAGRIDVARAITQTVVTEPASISIGTIAWPHDDDVPVTKPLTYRNLGKADVTLSLALDTTAPAGMFSLSANEVTVPAGGSAEVMVTGDAKAGTEDGYFSAAVVATSGAAVARTPVALDREKESYDLTVDAVDENGAPPGAYVALLAGLDNSVFAFVSDADGSVTVRVPKGAYHLDGTIFTGAHVALVVAPNLLVDKDTTVTVDARAAKPADITPPSAATLELGNLGYLYQTDTINIGAAFLTNDLTTVSTAHLGPAAPSGFVATVNTQWLGEDGSFYGLTWFPRDRLPTGFTKHVTKEDLATVRADIGAPVPGRTGTRVLNPAPTQGEALTFGVHLPVELGKVRTEYLTTDAVKWQSAVEQRDGDILEANLVSPHRTYQAGRDYTERYNHAVFGPAMPDTGFPVTAVTRTGNHLYIAPSLYGDGAGHAGASIVDSARLELYRDGELIGSADDTTGYFEVPPAAAEYRVVIRTTRPDAVFDVSTAVDVAWTFRSAYVNDTDVISQPVSALRFTPKLDETNSAQAGTRFLIPVALQHNETGELGRPRTLTVDVSYDEGRTWQQARTIANLAVLVDHPAAAESVSLRASATDRSGNAVTQTILRAYKLRK